jgi:hypothetical protein
MGEESAKTDLVEAKRSPSAAYGFPTDHGESIQRIDSSKRASYCEQGTGSQNSME